MSFCINWRCPECRHEFYTGSTNGKNTKKALTEKLEEGFSVTCDYCDTDTELNENNATVVKNPLE